jgi:hypothetical protein
MNFRYSLITLAAVSTIANAAIKCEPKTLFNPDAPGTAITEKDVQGTIIRTWHCPDPAKPGDWLADGHIVLSGMSLSQVQITDILNKVLLNSPNRYETIKKALTSGEIPVPTTRVAEWNAAVAMSKEQQIATKPPVVIVNAGTYVVVKASANVADGKKPVYDFVPPNMIKINGLRIAPGTVCGSLVYQATPKSGRYHQVPGGVAECELKP